MHLLLLCLFACGDKDDSGSPGDGGSTDGGGSSDGGGSADGGGSTDGGFGDGGGSTDGGGTDGGGTGDGGGDPGPDHATWVVQSLVVAGRTDGFDLDGNGGADNAIWALGPVLDPLLAAALEGAARVLLVQLAQVEDWTDDEEVRVAMFAGEDSDGDPSDNGSGEEVFQVGAAVGKDGLALISVGAPLAGGEFVVAFGESGIDLGSLHLESATGIYLRGEPAPASLHGVIGFGVDAVSLSKALTALGASPELAKGVLSIADLDTDSDGTDDAVSMAFTFDAISCGVAPTE